MALTNEEKLRRLRELLIREFDVREADLILETIEVSLLNYVVDGVVNTDTEFDINSSNALSNAVLTEFRNSLATPPTYISPTATLVSSQEGTVEVGTILNVLLGVTFTQNDAGASILYSLLKGNTTLSSIGEVISYTDTFKIQEETIQYKGNVSYEDGIIKDNPQFGFPDNNGQILAGDVDTVIKTITGRARVWYGAVSSIPTNSAEIRAISNNVWNNANSVSINTGTTNKIFIVVVPSIANNPSSLSAQDITNNVSYAYNYITTRDVILPNIDEDLKEYALYALEVGNPYPIPATHVVTL